MPGSSQTHRLYFLDHLRGLAILMVFLFHCLGAAYGYDKLEWNGWFRDFGVDRSFLLLVPLTLGGLGVPLFFVISGFCVHLGHWRSPNKSLANFATRRLLRIYPPYLLVLLLCWFVFPWRYAPFMSDGSPAMFLSHLFLVHNFDPNYLMGINPALWTIAIETQLYVIYPLLLFIGLRFGWRVALVISAIAEFGLLLIAPFFPQLFPAWPGISPFRFWFSWSIGAACAEAYLTGKKLPFSWIPIWVFPLALILAWAFRPLENLTFTLAALSTAVLIDRLLKRSLKKNDPERTPASPVLVRGYGALGSRHLASLGLVSYSFYLLHQPLLWQLKDLLLHLLPGNGIHPFVLFFILAGLGYGGIYLHSVVFYRFVEMPSVALGAALLRRKAKARDQSANLPQGTPAA